MHNITFVRSYRRKGKRNINEIQHIDNVVIECITLEYSDPTSEAAGTLLYLWILGDDKYINHNIYWMHNIVLSDAHFLDLNSRRWFEMLLNHCSKSVVQASYTFKELAAGHILLAGLDYGHALIDYGS